MMLFSEIKDRKGLKFLKPKDDDCVEMLFVPEQTEYTHAIGGKIYIVVSWDTSKKVTEPYELSLAFDCYVKWDGCSHLHFLGEEEQDKDSYYHLCGIGSYFSMMRAMVFAYELMVKKVGYDQVEYHERESLKNLRKLELLSDYDILDEL